MLDASTVLRRYVDVRARTIALSAPLGDEDMVAQSMPDASPTKWHLAHTTWFFEAFVLARFDEGHRPFAAGYDFLFNSYYDAVGPRHARAERGLITRPTVDDVRAYRAAIDARMRALLERAKDGAASRELLEVALLGTHHEEQHQELLLTDILHALSRNPLRPAYGTARAGAQSPALPLAWISVPERLASMGHDGDGFAFDNERPRHRAFVEPFVVASRLVTNAEYLEFVVDGGYARPELWLSDGWATAQREAWRVPLYWEERDGAWTTFALGGAQVLDPHAPVCHVSHYEADAYARWAGARLPTEHEWEVVAGDVAVDGNLLDRGRLAPDVAPSDTSARPMQLFGDTWEWTASPYVAYPRFRPFAGALGEYNGKFMSGQMVLRGGSCLTPRDHIRATYRNFFAPSTRWQMSGIRLARWP
jgi:ergothioneine biosynthesis protein EgtB